MPTRASSIQLNAAITALRTSPVSVDDVGPEFGSKPGLYAFYASPSTWAELALSEPGDGRPLYVGKAESTLASRDVAGHFAIGERGIQSPTGSSTLRRSLAALLAPARRYRGVPRQPCQARAFLEFRALHRARRGPVGLDAATAASRAVAPRRDGGTRRNRDWGARRIRTPAEPGQGRHAVALAGQGGAQGPRR
jgi:hypothetical protein